MFLRLRALVAASAVAAAPLAVAASAVPAGAAMAKHYANCDALHHDWKHGVAKSRKAAAKQVRDGYGRPAYGPKARAVYWENHTSLDRDKDGTACEA